MSFIKRFLWRGPLWAIVAFLAGFVIGSAVFGDESDASTWLATIIAVLVYIWVVVKDSRK